MIDERFIIRVSDFQPELLPYPRKKIGKCESLKELPIVSVCVGLWSSCL